MVGHMWCAHVDAHLADAGANTDSSAGVLTEAQATETVRAARQAG
jgi:hypothetical protein